MSTVAQRFPARTQPDGTIWYRSGARANDGWGSNIEQADASYRAADAPPPIPYPADPWVTNTLLDAVIIDAALAADTDSDGCTILPHVPDRCLPEIIIDGKRLDWPKVMAEPLRPKLCAGCNYQPAEIGLLYCVGCIAKGVGEAFDRTELYRQPEDEMPGTSLTEDLEIAPRYTKWCRFELPPEPPRATVVYGQWGWYRLPAPTTGRPTGFPRATTIAKTIDDERGLEKWKRRETALRVLKLTKLKPETVLNEFYETTAADALAALTKAADSGVGNVDDALEKIDDLMGGAEARELGECAHAWIEALAIGTALLKDVPDVVKPHVHFAREVMKKWGIVAESRYVERVVLNDRGDETIAGRIDCIWRIVSTGERVLGDVKTGKSLKYGWLPFGVQVGGVYGWAARMLSEDGKSWERMPKLVGVPHPDDHADDCAARDDVELWAGEGPCLFCSAEPDERAPYAILLHVPSDQPEHASAVTIDLNWGAEVLMESLSARSRQKEAPKEVPKHIIPAPTDAALRYVAARMALTEITTPEDGQTVYESFQDVWDDDLDEFATAVASLL